MELDFSSDTLEHCHEIGFLFNVVIFQLFLKGNMLRMHALDLLEEALRLVEDLLSFQTTLCSPLCTYVPSAF